MKLKKEFLEKLKEPKYIGLFISHTGLPPSTVERWLKENFYKLKLYEDLIKEILETEEQIFENNVVQKKECKTKGRSFRYIKK